MSWDAVRKQKVLGRVKCICQIFESSRTSENHLARREDCKTDRRGVNVINGLLTIRQLLSNQTHTHTHTLWLYGYAQRLIAPLLAADVAAARIDTVSQRNLWDCSCKCPETHLQLAHTRNNSARLVFCVAPGEINRKTKRRAPNDVVHSKINDTGRHLTQVPH